MVNWLQNNFKTMEEQKNMKSLLFIPEKGALSE